MSTHVRSSIFWMELFDNRNKSLTAYVLKQGLSSTVKVFKQGYQYHKLRKLFSNSITDTQNWMFDVLLILKTLLYQGISEQVFYADLVYKF